MTVWAYWQIGFIHKFLLIPVSLQENENKALDTCSLLTLYKCINTVIFNVALYKVEDINDKISLYLYICVTSVFSFTLNIVSINLQNENVHKQMTTDGFDLQEIKRNVTVFLCFDIFYFLNLADDIAIYFSLVIINGNLLTKVAVKIFIMKTEHNTTLNSYFKF